MNTRTYARCRQLCTINHKQSLEVLTHSNMCSPLCELLGQSVIRRNRKAHCATIDEDEICLNGECNESRKKSMRWAKLKYKLIS